MTVNVSNTNAKNKSFNNYILSGPTWLRITLVYWIVLVNVGLSYLFVHLLGKV
jgi:hypothetical protein